MTTPSDETVRIALALPLEARRALCGASGPGWLVMDGDLALPHPEYRQSLLNGWLRLEVVPELPDDMAWLPASEGEVLRVWSLHEGHGADMDIGDDNYTRVSGVAEAYDRVEDHDGTYDSRLRAALLCCPIGAGGGDDGQ